VKPSLLVAAVVLAGCEPSAAPPVSLAGMALDARGVAGDAGPAPGRCPQDAPWNGRVCLGQGYVACPGDERLDDAGSCQRVPGDRRETREVADAGRDAR